MAVSDSTGMIASNYGVVRHQEDYELLLTKVKESYSRSIETSLRNNGWWLDRLAAEIIYDYEPLWFTTNTNKAVDWITKEAIVEAANKYLNTERVVTGYLKPEGK